MGFIVTGETVVQAVVGEFKGADRSVAQLDGSGGYSVRVGGLFTK